MPQSLTQFCRQHNLAKTSVHRYLTAQGFDLSQGLTSEAIAAARAEFLTPTFPPEQPQVLPPVGDPFAGVGIVPWQPLGQLTPIDRGAASSALAAHAAFLIHGAAAANQAATAAAVGAAQQLGDQLGAALAGETISAAERRRQEILTQYLEAQGVQVGESQAGKSDGPAAA